MGVLFGVQPTCCECMVILDEGQKTERSEPCPFEACPNDCEVSLRRLRTGATDEEVLWFEATHVPSGLTVKADEIPGKPGVMSTIKARGDAGKQRIVDKLLKAVEEFGNDKG